jgi:hypothetical protein
MNPVLALGLASIAAFGLIILTSMYEDWRRRDNLRRLRRLRKRGLA